MYVLMRLESLCFFLNIKNYKRKKKLYTVAMSREYMLLFSGFTLCYNCFNHVDLSSNCHKHNSVSRDASRIFVS